MVVTIGQPYKNLFNLTIFFMKKTVLILGLVLTSLIAFACATQYDDEKNMHNEMMEEMDEHMEDMDEMMGENGMMGGKHMMDDNGMMGDNDMMGMMQNDEDFLAMMIPHHQEAIDTAKIILGGSQNADLKELAENIVTTQTAEIAQMQEWGTKWHGTDFKASEKYMAMMPDLTKLSGEELDQAFITGMIHHHKGAIMMAEKVKKMTEHQELLDMADAIIEAQTKEVEMMEGWVK